MAPQTETRAGAGFKAGVKDYRLTYYTPDYQPKDTDILAAFRMTPQPGVPPEECGAAVAAESRDTVCTCKVGVDIIFNSVVAVITMLVSIV